MDQLKCPLNKGSLSQVGPCKNRKTSTHSHSEWQPLSCDGDVTESVMYIDRVEGEACDLFCNLSFSSSLFNNDLFRKRPQVKMCGGDEGEPDSSASSPHKHEQRRSPVSALLSL